MGKRKQTIRANRAGKWCRAALLIGLFCCLRLPAAAGDSASWQAIEPGLFIGEFTSPQKSILGDSRITILKIDPEYYDFRLLLASEHNRQPRTIKQWAREFGLTAAVNAGMYQEDLLTSVGFMVNYDHVNNGHLNKNNAIFAFGRRDSLVPPAQLIDRTCQDFEALRGKYQCFLQSIRMISCEERNVWTPQRTRWSMVVLGVDADNRVLFIFTRSPYSVHDFINILLELPIQIRRAMYLEGGPRATLYLSYDDMEVEKTGSFETAVIEHNNIKASWPLPNVLGIVKKRKSK